ncbi:ATP-binding cassette domain-containing protein [Streptomyces sp. NPDC052040]|uniref:ATP-binding cassette domain-containing protein n=1 Tax=Streptomyces sp. NPDC052040 TaxID=3365682 RepID=UPI0037D6C0E4
MQEEAAGAAVEATDLGLKGPRGPVFRGIRVAARPGALIAVEGPSGSGRTSLLLALTGRMKPTEGSAVVGGHRLPKEMSAVRRISAVANMSGVTDLEPALTVAEHLRERALLESRFGDSLRALLRPRSERSAAARHRIDTAVTAAGLDLEALPKGPRTAVRDLERLEALRLSIALALISRPRLLAVDDTDLKLSPAEQTETWALLRSLAAAGTTVFAVCAEAPQDVTVVSTASGYRVPQGEAPAPSDEPAKPSEPVEPSEPAKDSTESEKSEPAKDSATSVKSARSGDSQDSQSPQGSSQGSQDTEAAAAATPDEQPSRDGAEDDKETADALAETGRA